MDKVAAAVVQMDSQEDKGRNLDQAVQYIQEAARRGANLVVLPEYFNVLGHKDITVKMAEDIPGPTIDTLRDVAREAGIGLLCGSIPERTGQSHKIRNTAVFVSDKGKILATYSKIHLFDINVPNEVSYLESEYIEPGRSLKTFDWKGIRFGMAICYDLRFPELFRCLVQQGVQVVLLPAAFTQATGLYHWQPLVRARAIENQVFLCAANQSGNGSNWIPTFGHSAIIDPWGKTLCEIPEGTGIGIAELDMRELARIRTASPILTHIQPWLLKRLGDTETEEIT